MVVDFIQPEFDLVSLCPLCGGRATDIGALKLDYARFGRYRIALPRAGVPMLFCSECDLLFKGCVPTPDCFSRLMAGEATGVWKPKRGEHPALPLVEPHISSSISSALDIGASNGDWLRALAGRANRRSALDVVRFPDCEPLVSGEYVIGSLDAPLPAEMSRHDLVTAFDVFEHFRDARLAISNLSRLVLPGGLLVIETGDWRADGVDPCDWYYSRLFEHHIFWSSRGLAVALEKAGFTIRELSCVTHKGRRALPVHKRIAMQGLVEVARHRNLAAMVERLTGRDPRLFGSPWERDHVFLVAQYTAVH